MAGRIDGRSTEAGRVNGKGPTDRYRDGEVRSHAHDGRGSGGDSRLDRVPLRAFYSRNYPSTRASLCSTCGSGFVSSIDPAGRGGVHERHGAKTDFAIRE